MALNAAILTSDNSISLYEGEKIFCTSKGVRLYLETGGYVDHISVDISDPVTF